MSCKYENAKCNTKLVQKFNYRNTIACVCNFPIFIQIKLDNNFENISRFNYTFIDVLTQQMTMIKPRANSARLIKKKLNMF